MSQTVTINNKTPSAVIIDNEMPSVATVTTANIPPSTPIDFGSLITLFNSMTPQSTPPSSPTENDVYLDDGTNTASGTLGFRQYDGSAWEDFGLQDATNVEGLDDLTDVIITGVSDGDLLLYDTASGQWENQDKLDGGVWA